MRISLTLGGHLGAVDHFDLDQLTVEHAEPLADPADDLARVAGVDVQRVERDGTVREPRTTARLRCG